MPKSTIAIYIESDAPRKPALGAPCNGCGVCCLMEPCPLGVLLSGRRSGACIALRWQPSGRYYRCGALTEASDVLRERLPVFVQFARPALVWLLARLGRRWIAAGVGCDCEVVDMEDVPEATLK
jgi:hypothetical protein